MAAGDVAVTATPLLSDEDEIAAVNVAFVVAKGADSVRKLAVYFGVAVDDREFQAAFNNALLFEVVRFTAGCCNGGHNLNCELEIVR
jgi:hypothetical protein